jgi:hypothetical protein
MSLNQEDMKWLDDKFSDIYEHIDAAAESARLREKACRAEVDARIGATEQKANKAAEQAAAIAVEVDWHKWYIRLALGGLITSTSILSVLIVVFRG